MKRGANVSLTREIPGLRASRSGVKWNAGAETALADNLVMAAILCDAHGRALSDEHFVFFNQLASPELSVHEVDKALGADNEQVEIDLAAVPPEVERIVAVLYINDGPAQRRTLGQLRSCVVRVAELRRQPGACRPRTWPPHLSTETAIVLGEVYRHDGEWKFRVLGQGYAKGSPASPRTTACRCDRRRPGAPRDAPVMTWPLLRRIALGAADRRRRRARRLPRRPSVRRPSPDLATPASRRWISSAHRLPQPGAAGPSSRRPAPVLPPARRPRLPVQRRRPGARPHGRPSVTLNRLQSAIGTLSSRRLRPPRSATSGSDVRTN